MSSLTTDLGCLRNLLLSWSYLCHSVHIGGVGIVRQRLSALSSCEILLPGHTGGYERSHYCPSFLLLSFLSHPLPILVCYPLIPWLLLTRPLLKNGNLQWEIFMWNLWRQLYGYTHIERQVAVVIRYDCLIYPRSNCLHTCFASHATFTWVEAWRNPTFAVCTTQAVDSLSRLPTRPSFFLHC